MSQSRHDLLDDNSVFQEISENAEFVDVGNMEVPVRTYMASFNLVGACAGVTWCASGSIVVVFGRQVTLPVRLPVVSQALCSRRGLRHSAVANVAECTWRRC